MRVWVVVSRKSDGQLEVEIFGDRPHTDNDPSNWPTQFEVYEGNVNGGDSLLVETRGGQL